MPLAEPAVVIEQLWQPLPREPEFKVFAILDGARDERIYPRVVESGLAHCCLYRGELEPDLAAAAPYLVQLEPDAAFTSWMIAQGWGDSWGVFAKAPVTMPELRRHLRRFLMVYDPDGKPLYFRYYDPRVLRVYLPTCNADELRIIFGPVMRYCFEAEDPNRLLELRFLRGKLETRELALPNPRRAAV